MVPVSGTVPMSGKAAVPFNPTPPGFRVTVSLLSVKPATLTAGMVAASEKWEASCTVPATWTLPSRGIVASPASERLLVPRAMVAFASDGTEAASWMLDESTCPLPPSFPPVHVNPPTSNVALSTRVPEASERFCTVRLPLAVRLPPERLRPPVILDGASTWSEPAESVIAARLVRLWTESAAEDEWVMVIPVLLITTSSWRVGTFPPLQLDAVSQFPPLGLVQEIVERTTRSSRHSNAIRPIAASRRLIPRRAADLDRWLGTFIRNQLDGRNMGDSSLLGDRCFDGFWGHRVKLSVYHRLASRPARSPGKILASSLPEPLQSHEARTTDSAMTPGVT